MRISGGNAKGRNVGPRKAFATRADGDELRPTSSKVRKAVFDILGARVIDSRFLDLYAGSGAVGIEAASRDAAFVQFVEKDAKRAVIIRDTLAHFGFSDRAGVMAGGAMAFLKNAGSEPFDIVFVDPPYGSDEIGRILPILADNPVLREEGLAVIEHAAKKPVPADIPGLTFKKNYRYGDTALTVLIKRRHAEPEPLR
jgi:16S rRNA (guanine(966)-N(2))-methyltransferase RsmD